jgi:hypothetical protein
MNPSIQGRPYSAQQLNRLHDQAHAQAASLRREAIDAFWHAIWRRLVLPHRASPSIGVGLHAMN